MIRNKNIVIVGLQPWDIEIGSNCKNIAIEFSKCNNVLYVNAPVDRYTLIKEKKNPRIIKRLNIMKGDKQLFQVSERMWNLYPKSVISSINWMPFTSAFRLMNWVNNKKFAEDIKQALTDLSFDEFILFIDSDMFRSYYLKEFLHPSLTVYYSRDNLMAVDYWRKHGKTLEPELMKKSDLVVTNSPFLTSLASNYNPKSFYVGQGCDVSIFGYQQDRPIPKDFPKVNGPVIGYIGAIISNRLDITLLLELCRKKHEWNFVFVGPADKEFTSSGLFDLDNVYFLGLKSGNELPDYLACFDVAINPQLINEMTIGNYPRKIDEYLAMGKPVVATATETMSIFGDLVYLGKTVDEYIQLIEMALSEDHSKIFDKRVALANAHTWENSVQEISNAIVKTKPELFADGVASI